MLTLIRYAVPTEADSDLPPLREIATWIELAEDTVDPRAADLGEFGSPGKWLLLSCSDSLADLSAQVTEATLNRFNEMTDPGGQVIGSMDLYWLPLMDGYRLATEDEYVAVYNERARAVPGTPLISEGN